MKNVMAMAMTGILTVAMALTACGKDSQPSEPESAEEALQRINEELNAIIEEDRREAEERAQRAERDAEEYPEGVIPEGDYFCQYLQDMYIEDKDSEYAHVPMNLEIYSDDVFLDYEYDAETKEYSIMRRYYEYGNAVAYKNWDHLFVGYLDEEGNLIINYYERIGDNGYNFILDDVEWVYVRQ